MVSVLALVFAVGSGASLASDPVRAIFDGCVDKSGKAVLVQLDKALADLAVATRDREGEPVIVYNPGRLGWLSSKARLFFAAHECAHHALGHLGGRTDGYDKEQQADCWAIRRLNKAGELAATDLPDIQQEVSRLGRADATHIPGVARASNLKWCLVGVPPEPEAQPASASVPGSPPNSGKAKKR